MLRRLFGVSLLGGLLVILQAPEAQAQKKPMDKPADAEKLTGGEFVGILKSVPGSDRMFTIEVEKKTLVQTKAASVRTIPGRPTNLAPPVVHVLNMEKAVVNAQNRVRTAKTPQARQSAANSLLNAQIRYQLAVNSLVAHINRATGATVVLPPGYGWKVSKQDIEFQAREDVKVKSKIVTDAFDDKGNPRKLTAKEAAALKAGGADAKMENLEIGQVVSVTLAPAPAKKSDKDKEADAEEKKMQVKSIVIVNDGKNLPGDPKKKG